MADRDHRLIFIKHAPPQVDPNKPSDDWVLSDEGRAKARAIVEPLRKHDLQSIVTSVEPKAAETGQIIADALGIPCEQAKGLHEHDRSNVPVMRTSEFISAIAQFLKESQKLVLGRETAAGTLARFHRAVDDVLDAHPDQTIGIVTHGTVLAQYAAALLNEDPFRLWRQLANPSYLAFDREALSLIDRLDRLPPAP